MKLPDTEILDITILWLEHNEGNGKEREACLAVAKYLEHQNREAFIRREARCRGVSPASFRRLLERHDSLR